MLPHEIYLEIIQYLPSKNYYFRLLNRKFSKCKFPYDDWDVMIAIGYTVKIMKDRIEWYKNEKLHCPCYSCHGKGEDLPAIIHTNESQKWYKNGQKHRDNDLPAEIWVDGSQTWYKNGKYHRDNDLPAIIGAYGYQVWYVNGKRHRDKDLPAVINADGSQKWYKNGERYHP